MQPGQLPIDVFISYKSQQASWAIRLYDTLTDFGLTVWLDRERIRIGEEWRDEISEGIQNSQRMIVLWSHLVRDNIDSVVHLEIDEMAHIKGQDNSRRFIPVQLDDAPLKTILAPYHADLSLNQLVSYYGNEGAYQVPVPTWYKSIERLLQTLGINDLVEIRYVVAAMNRSQAQQLHDNPGLYAHQPQTLEMMKSVLQISSQFDVSRYGDSPDDWVPFPQLAGRLTIRELVSSYDLAKKDWYKREQRGRANWFIASYSDALFSTELEKRDSAHATILNGPCLLILDPLSLMHRHIFDTIISGMGLPYQPDTYVIGIAPFISTMHMEMYESARQIDETLSHMLSAAYARYRDPFDPYDRLCVLNIADDRHLTRWVQAAADSIFLSRKTPLRYGGPHPTVVDLIARRRWEQRGPSSQLLSMAGEQ